MLLLQNIWKMNREVLVLLLNLMIPKCLLITAYKDLVRGLQRNIVTSVQLYTTGGHCIADEFYCAFHGLCLTLGDRLFQILALVGRGWISKGILSPQGSGNSYVKSFLSK